MKPCDSLGGAEPHRLVNQLASLAGLLKDGRDELLAAKARVHGHEQDDVDLVHNVLQIIKRGRWVENKARLAASIANERERTVNVVGSLRMESDVAGACKTQ